MKSLAISPALFTLLVTCSCNIIPTNSVCIEGATATYQVYSNLTGKGTYYVISKITDQKNLVRVYDAYGNAYDARIEGMSGNVQQNINSQIGDMSDWIENADEAGYTTVQAGQYVSNGQSAGMVGVAVSTSGTNQCGEMIIMGTTFNDWNEPFYVPN